MRFLLFVGGMECDHLQCPFESNMVGNILGFVSCGLHCVHVQLKIRLHQDVSQYRRFDSTNLQYLGSNYRMLDVMRPANPTKQINPTKFSLSLNLVHRKNQIIFIKTIITIFPSSFSSSHFLARCRAPYALRKSTII